MPYVHKQYFICPFPNYDTVVGAQVTKYRTKTNCTAVPPFHEALIKVEKDATLLIAGHGVEGGDEMSNGMTKPNRVSLNVLGLAQLISTVWKLPTTHCKIRLLGCECSGFARKLALALKDYDSVAVGGFIDNMNFDNFNKKNGRGSPLTQITVNETIRLLSKEAQVKNGIARVYWYNNKGQAIDKPQFPKLIFVED
jgi:hypothetical protein